MSLVHRTVRDGVAVVELNDPERRNVLSAAMVEELVAAVEDVERDESAFALVVTGAGSAFCAGAHRDDLAAAAGGRTDRLREIYAGFLRVGRCALPTIAAVNGPAVGAGFNLALACDVRIAAEEAVFDSRFARLGIHPGGGHTWMLDRAVGRQAAAALLLFGESLDGEAAVTAGLALRCVPRARLLDAALALARGASGAPRAVLSTITASLREAAALPDLASAVEVEFERQVESLRAPGVTTRLGHRPTTS
ncbi:enoyl-CoA hydratase [Amycolatopsis arida]|uniref:Enoyl-CoA hydratase n=1 Tax=Amycolatopsis arida TaxID=587909 RepID=A0A1I5SQG9_9PSEU|nr:enoyl-CoA hydratase [Amycolatopsis arida]TDX96389.1 enoyl-CoA hydratase [Amycolatopsis arida]SFP72928.1 enoyl-CoA hydratase [Amycolatopsis arida]